MLINQEILLEISNGQSIKEGVMFYKFNESGNVFVLFCEKKETLIIYLFKLFQMTHRLQTTMV